MPHPSGKRLGARVCLHHKALLDPQCNSCMRRQLGFQASRPASLWARLLTRAHKVGMMALHKCCFQTLTVHMAARVACRGACEPMGAQWSWCGADEPAAGTPCPVDACAPRCAQRLEGIYAASYVFCSKRTPACSVVGTLDTRRVCLEKLRADPSSPIQRDRPLAHVRLHVAQIFQLVRRGKSFERSCRRLSACTRHLRRVRAAAGGP